jgi:hypothetical protein
MSAAAGLLVLSSLAGPSAAQTSASLIEEALQNITAIVRPGRVGYATIWDGNKYVQCRRMPTRDFRCEAAGTSMQPSLTTVLTGERINRLTALGWTVDPRFGNYAQTFAVAMPPASVAQHVLRTLLDAYDANAANIEVKTDWVVDLPCPPRNGPSQNLAGMINDAFEMLETAIYTCSYTPDTNKPQRANSAADLIAIYGATAAAEIQRLRINATRNVFVIFGAGIGYVQCAPEMPSRAIYCEAQSAQSWPALAAVLTPSRLSYLRQAGYAEPGRAPNYWKRYAAGQLSDRALAEEILTLLHEVYGYNGATKLEIETE